MKVGIPQQMSRTSSFLQENGIGIVEELKRLLTSTEADFDEKLISLKDSEDRIKTKIL